MPDTCMLECAGLVCRHLLEIETLQANVLDFVYAEYKMARKKMLGAKLAIA
jgi:hypothetical protein